MDTTIEKKINDTNKIEVFTSILAKRVEKYFQDEEHRRQFEEWYRKKYGKEYEWR